MLRLIFCTPRIWIGPGRKEPPISLRFTRKCVATSLLQHAIFIVHCCMLIKKITPRNLKQNVKTVIPIASITSIAMFRQTGMPRRFANLLLQLWNRPHDRVYIVRDEKGQNFSTEWQTFLVVKCLTNTKRQLTCPQHVTEHTRVLDITRYQTMSCVWAQLQFMIYISVSHGRLQQTKDVQSWLSSRTVFCQACFKWLLVKELPAEKKNTTWKRHIMNCMGYHLLLEMQRIHSTKIQVVSILLGFK